MTLRCFSFHRTRLPLTRLARGWARVAGLALLAAIAGGCGGESSTDTGNPPVVLGQKLRLTATETGVVVIGDPGAVPAGSRVDVINTTTGQTVTTTAAEDGSFELELEGSAEDEYRVYAASGDESWRTRLTSSGSAPAQTGLVGLEYLLQSADGYTLVGSTTMRLAFDERELRLSAGCNSQSAEYSLCDGRLCVSSLVTTDIGCEPALHAQDEWIAGFLRGSPTLTQAGATLTLAGADATLEFLDSEVADADRPLTGRVWTVDTFIDGAAASNVPTPASPTLQFGADGSLAVFATCNSGTGSYTRSGQTLTLGQILYSEAGCSPPSSADSEQRVMSVMQAGEVSFEIDAARLTIRRGTVGLSATTD